MDKIPSFIKNHDIIDAGLAISMEMSGLTTWDLRFKKPNAGDYISPKAMHTIEHILATILRNSDRKDDVMFVGPMGCRTGFYVVTKEINYEEILDLLKRSFRLALTLTKIPGGKRVECGNYLEHDLEEAKKEMAQYLELLNTL